MKRTSTSKILIVAAALVVFAVLAGFFFVWPPDHTEVRNLSGQSLTNVVLELRDHQRSDWRASRRVAVLRPGESFRIRHSHNDTSAVVEFALGGQRFRHEEGYIDLWTGEGWRFDIQSNGTVKAEYDYTARR
jgi:hypothetical protein